MEQGFIDILTKLVKEQGAAALTDAKKCKAFLADYTGNEYRKERRLILQAAEAGIAKVIAGAQDITACKKAQVRELEEEYSLSTAAALGIVDALALVLRGDTSPTTLGAATKPASPPPIAPLAVPAPVVVAEEQKNVTPALIYGIGSTGPAGGIIFYDKGLISGGWRYLEAAPAHTEFKGKWGKPWEYWLDKNKDVTTSYKIGSGRGNTRSMDFNGSPIARQVTELNINGFTGWFLPSSDELDLMYRNLKEKGLGGFSDNWYWSSTQSYSTFHADNLQKAVLQYFGNGNYVDSTKDSNNLVRAARAF